MQTLKRVLLFFVEIGILFAGLALSVAVTYYLDRFSDGTGPLSFVFFFGPLILSVVGFFLFRRRSRRWKIRYDATNYLKHRSSQRLNPRQTKRIRTTWRCLRWIPSICAAFALFFLPVASRIVYPATLPASGYRFSLPLNWMMVGFPNNRPDVYSAAMFTNEGAGHYGLTPMWFTRSLPSIASFLASDQASPDEWYRPNREATAGHPTHVAKSEFTMGVNVVDCFEYVDTFEGGGDSYFPGWRYRRDRWQILCSTQPNGRNFHLRMEFFGQKEDIPAFYRVLKSATPTT